MRRVALLIVLVGCEGPPAESLDLAGEDVCDSLEPAYASGALPSPDEMPDDGCVPGGLLDVDIERPWYVRSDIDEIFTTTHVGFGRQCGQLTTSEGALAERTGDYLYWGWSQDLGQFGTFGIAFKACRVDPTGALGGHVVVIDGDLRTVGSFTAEPFGWAAGESQGSGLEELASWSGPEDAPWPVSNARDVAVRDGIAYFVFAEGLRTIDVSNPTAPTDLGWWPARRETLNDVQVTTSGGFVFAVLASNELGAVVIDVTDPSHPVEVRRFSPAADGWGTHSVFIDDSGDHPVGYFVDGVRPVLSVYDLANPARPTAVTRYEDDGDGDPFAARGFHDLFVAERTAYVNATDAGFAIFDLADPRQPRLVGQLGGVGYSHSNWVTTAAGRKVSVHGDEGTPSSVRIVDVDQDSPQFLQVIGEFHLRPEVSVHNITARGDRAYVAYYQNGVRVLDLSDPTAPRQIAYFNTWNPLRARGASFEGAFGLDVDSEHGLVFVADSESGLVILRENIAPPP